jgi:hypothetical protein
MSATTAPNRYPRYRTLCFPAFRVLVSRPPPTISKGKRAAHTTALPHHRVCLGSACADHELFLPRVCSPWCRWGLYARWPGISAGSAAVMRRARATTLEDSAGARVRVVAANGRRSAARRAIVLWVVCKGLCKEGHERTTGTAFVYGCISIRLK